MRSAALVCATLAGLLLAPRAASAEPYGRAPLRACATRAEAQAPQPGPRGGDLVFGPAYLNAGESLGGMPATDFTPGDGRRFVPIKVALSVRASQRVVLVIPKRERRWAGLGYAQPPDEDGPFTVANGGAAVRFRSCAARTPAFSYRGRVGRWTVFTGEFLVSRPGCLPLELRTNGRVRRATVSFGAGACGALVSGTG